jgi:hypothetical protein
VNQVSELEEAMIDTDICRQNAADCVREAQADETPEGRNILLNIALAWLRLAQQTELQAASIDEFLSAGLVPDLAPDQQVLDQPKNENVSV